MLNQELDIFDLKRIQVHHTKDEFIKMGQAAQSRINSRAICTCQTVDRDPLQYIKFTESKIAVTSRANDGQPLHLLSGHR